MDLPDDIRLYIYSYLLLKEMKNIEKDKELYLLRFKTENRDRSEHCHRIYKNLIENTCFYCPYVLDCSYIINICSDCRFTIDNESMYPMYCGNCVTLQKKRNFETRFCKICNAYSAFLGIEPYS